MRYDNDGVRAGVLIKRSRFHLETPRGRRPVTGIDRNGEIRGGGKRRRRGSLKVLLFDYVYELVWFCTRLNEFLFMFVFQLLYER